MADPWIRSTPTGPRCQQSFQPIPCELDGDAGRLNEDVRGPRPATPNADILRRTFSAPQVGQAISEGAALMLRVNLSNPLPQLTQANSKIGIADGQGTMQLNGSLAEGVGIFGMENSGTFDCHTPVTPNAETCFCTFALPQVGHSTSIAGTFMPRMNLSNRCSHALQAYSRIGITDLQ